MIQVFAATNGFLDRINVDRVPAFLADLVSAAHARHQDLREKIGAGDWSDETQAALRAAVAESAEDFGYDLDEEGQPLEDDAAVDRSDDDGAAPAASHNGGATGLSEPESERPEEVAV